ncbi:MAG: hypothetical protein RIR69_285 [Actinomycetota bacterium]
MSRTPLSRVLAGALEPVTGQVYFSPECHSNYEKLGFAPSRGEFNGVMAPDGPAYFTSRGSVMGQVPGEVVAAAFGVFNPQVVIPAVTYGWTLTDARTICDARDNGAIGQLHRVLGETPAGAERARELLQRANSTLRPEGRPLYSGLRSLHLPDSLMGHVWRLGDMLREYRGDSHTAAWISAGFTACEIGIVSELYWGLPIKSYSKTRGWSDDDYAQAIERLEKDSLIAHGELTSRGREQREKIEQATDTQCQPILDALGDDATELISILQPWCAAIRQAKGYPAAGPHDLADSGSAS